MFVVIVVMFCIVLLWAALVVGVSYWILSLVRCSFVGLWLFDGCVMVWFGLWCFACGSV